MQTNNQVSPDNQLRVFVMTQSQAQFLQKHIADEINEFETMLHMDKHYMNKHYEKCNKDLKEDSKVKIEFAQYSFWRNKVKFHKKQLKKLREIQYNIKRNI